MTSKERPKALVPAGIEFVGTPRTFVEETGAWTTHAGLAGGTIIAFGVEREKRRLKRPVFGNRYTYRWRIYARGSNGLGNIPTTFIVNCEVTWGREPSQKEALGLIAEWLGTAAQRLLDPGIMQTVAVQ